MAYKSIVSHFLLVRVRALPPLRQGNASSLNKCLTIIDLHSEMEYNLLIKEKIVQYMSRQPMSSYYFNCNFKN